MTRPQRLSEGHSLRLIACLHFEQAPVPTRGPAMTQIEPLKHIAQPPFDLNFQSRSGKDHSRMLIFCDESWRSNSAGKKVGTLAAVAVPSASYNDLEDRLFFLAQKYWGFENARSQEIKGKQLLSHYEYQRESRGEPSLKLAFAREVLEELRLRKLRVFASVVYSEKEVELLCEDEEQLERPYRYLMERINGYLQEQGSDTLGSITFDDRGLTQNVRVAEAYRNFLTRSKLGRSFSSLIRIPFFAYSKASAGLQIADLICTVINRYHTDRTASSRIPVLFSIVREMEWISAAPNAEGYTLRGIKIIGNKIGKDGPPFGGEG